MKDIDIEKTDREKAIKWFKNLGYSAQRYRASKHRGYLTNPYSITGREIEEIWKQHN